MSRESRAEPPSDDEPPSAERRAAADAEPMFTSHAIYAEPFTPPSRRHDIVTFIYAYADTPTPLYEDADATSKERHAIIYYEP